MLDVVDDEGRRLLDRARFGDVDARPVGRDGEVVQHREEARDLGREVVLVDELPARDVEGDDARLPLRVVGVIEHPEPILTIDAHRERVEVRVPQ